MADAATGSSGVIRVDVSESGLNPQANQSTINWAFYLIEASTNNSTWTGAAIPANVTWDDAATLWSGSFSFDWRGAGNQTTLIASGSFQIQHQPDGSGQVKITGYMGDTGTSGAGGPAGVAQSIALAVLKVAPGTPYSIGASRVSDTQIKVTWSQQSASNGQPTANSIARRVNNGSWGLFTSIAPTNSATLPAAANQKHEFMVKASHYTAESPYSSPSNPAWTTPAAPTSASAVKGSDGGITVSFTINVGYSEYQHEVWHGVVSGGTTTWDAAPLAILSSGVRTYKHASPNSAQVHVYRVRARTSAAPTTLYSGYATTGSVQLLAPPNKPTVPAMATRADRTKSITFTWAHNPVDSTSQTAYEFGTSLDGGSTWSTTGKVTSAAGSRTIAANTYAGDQTLTTRVRTWGQATTGGSDGTGASPWSDIRAVTFKTPPTASIVSPTNGATLNDATLVAEVGFAQPEAATFVQAEVTLVRAGVNLEQIYSSSLTGIQFSTQLQNGVSYSVVARVRDSNGLWSGFVTNNFNVVYLAPAAAIVTAEYLPESGFAQVNLIFPTPLAGQSAAAFVTVVRTIDGVDEFVVRNYPVTDELGLIDTVPTIHGTNVYTVTTISAQGAQTTTDPVTLVTEECRRAFLSKGQSFSNVIVFGGNLSVGTSLGVASDTVQAAGRVKPIGLYGVETSVQLKVSSFIFEGFGSTLDQIRDFLLVPGRACYRDATGRRVFGSVKGSVSYKKTTQGDLSFTLNETS